jgi:endogenous inhibitor of DNA gyrase (YacG/DUF329 family)
MAQSRRCPICKSPLEGREESLRFRPFCSRRCADIDLGRWLRGTYAIPAEEAGDGEPEAPEAEPGETDDVAQVRR